MVQKKVPTHTGSVEHGAELYYLSDEDVGKEEEDPTYFKIRLAYNGIHHYCPIVQCNVVPFLDAWGHAVHFTKGSRDSLKVLRGHLPKDSNFYKLVDCALQASICTTTVLSGCNILTGATGTAGATSAAEVFGYPSSQAPPSAKKRKTVAGVASVVSQPLDVEPTSSQAEKEPDIPPQDPEQDPTFRLPDVDDSRQITIPHDGDLKHSDTQCFCGKSELKTTQEHDEHFKKCHQQKGKGVNPKTKKRNDLWACHSCKKPCVDKRACWKHFRTQHLGIYIHYCPVPNCNVGNDQKDSIVSHIIKDHRSNEEWTDKAYKQKWLMCPKCQKFFFSVKGKNSHVPTCGKPKIKINCPYEHCHKTYTTEDALNAHIGTAHEGKSHRCLCPFCGHPFASKQSLDNHISKEHPSE